MEGIDEARVTTWFAANVADATPPLGFELIAGGRSNLTYRVTDSAGKEFVLRRPPLSHVLPTAHDMGREHRIVTALGPTPVPVPATFGYCDDEGVNGAPFYVMSFVQGTVPRDAETTRKVLDEAARRRAGESLVDVLADLHAVDVDAVGLGDLARRDGYIQRQLKRWYGQFRQSQEGTGRSVPLVDELHELLAARVPDQGGATIVHGDYRLDNTMLGDDGRCRAVLDWELCTLGDPLADVGLLMVYWPEPGDADPALGLTPTTLPGFPSRAEMRSRYGARSGRDVSALDFYVAFGYWKLACIVEGVHARYAGGAMGGDRSGVNAFSDQVLQLAQAAKAAADRL